MDDRNELKSSCLGSKRRTRAERREDFQALEAMLSMASGAMAPACLEDALTRGVDAIPPRNNPAGPKPTPPENPPVTRPAAIAAKTRQPKADPPPKESAVPQNASTASLAPESMSDADANAAYYDDVFRRGMEGDVSTIRDLERIFDQIPDLLDSFGDMVGHATEGMLTTIFGKQYPARVAILKKLAQMCAEMEDPESTPLERLLIRRISVCWLDVHLCDMAAAKFLKSSPEEGPANQSVQVRLTAANTRFLDAVRALAQTRRMLRPPVSRHEVEFGSSAPAEAVPEAVGKRTPSAEANLDSLFATGNLS